MTNLMTKEEYRSLFASALKRAVKNAEEKLGYAVPSDLQIILYDSTHSGDIVTFEDALNSLYLGSNRSYFVIDIGVKEVASMFTNVFVRASGHAPVEYEAVWNSPNGEKLFKQVYPEIKVSSSS